MRMVSRRGLLLAAAGLRAFSAELRLGQLLIATRKSRDPDLAESVVLLIQMDQREAAGLVVNRPSRSERGRDYDGGPIAQGVRALLRSESAPPGRSEHIFAGVYLLTDPDQIRSLAAAGASPRRLRVYQGRAGWTPGQLKNEVASGLWRVISADAALVFDPDPNGLWRRLADR
jgi:putative transcriptional regulator